MVSCLPVSQWVSGTMSLTCIIYCNQNKTNCWSTAVLSTEATTLMRIYYSCRYQAGKAGHSLLPAILHNYIILRSVYIQCSTLSNITYSKCKPLCSVCCSRHIQGSSVWWWTLTKTCPSTQSPSWKCIEAKNVTRCPRTSTPYQRPPIAACCKVLHAICDLWLLY